MTLTPGTARHGLDRLAPEDFPSWPARHAFTLLRDMTAAGVPSLDPATLVGHAQRTAAVAAHQWPGLTRFLSAAVSVNVPACALDFHIDLLLEATYRRRIHAAATRLAQLADTATLSDLDHHLAVEAADLDHHRARITTGLRPVTHHPERAA
ncbi:hypothetical protein GCM10023148_30870 [Actinokineospora soli]